MANQLYVFGMFRSGTTMIARAMNAHPNIAFASDPFQDLFKILRSQVAEESGQFLPEDSPLADYYFDPQGLELFGALQKASFSREFPSQFLGVLRDRACKRARSFCPDLAPALSEISGVTYRDLLTDLHNRIYVVYGEGKPNIEYTGFKEVWATEFLPHVLKVSQNARALVVVRDPRAVAASCNVNPLKYPWHFLGRQWRKLADLGWFYANNEEFGSRVKLLRYEDLILEPHKTFREICEFLKIEWFPSIMDPRSYQDGGGKVWVQNSSFNGGSAAFDREAVVRWRRALSSTEIGYLEWLCSPDMNLFGYTCSEHGERRSDAGWALSPPCIDPSAQAQWMRGIIPADRLSCCNVAAMESFRKAILDPQGRYGGDAEPDAVTASGACLIPELLPVLRKVM